MHSVTNCALHCCFAFRPCARVCICLLPLRRCAPVSGGQRRRSSVRLLLLLLGMPASQRAYISFAVRSCCRPRTAQMFLAEARAVRSRKVSLCTQAGQAEAALGTQWDNAATAEQAGKGGRHRERCRLSLGSHTCRWDQARLSMRHLGQLPRGTWLLTRLSPPGWPEAALLLVVCSTEDKENDDSVPGGGAAAARVDDDGKGKAPAVEEEEDEQDQEEEGAPG